MLLHQPLEILPCHAGRGGRLRDVSVERRELLGEKLAFEEVDHMIPRFAEDPADNGERHCVLLRLRCEVAKCIRKDDLSLGEHHGALNEILKFAHVARILIAVQNCERFPGKASHILFQLFIILLEEIGREQVDVLLPVPKRRELDRDDVQPEEQVFPERLSFDFGGEILIRRRDEPCFHAMRLVSPHPFKFPLLQHAEKLLLQRKAQNADFIEEYRPARGNFELPQFGPRPR